MYSTCRSFRLFQANRSLRRHQHAIALVVLTRSVAHPTGFIDPCLPTLAHAVPDGSRWAFEVKHDGFRFIARRDGDRVRVFSRNARDWSDRVPAIVRTIMPNETDEGFLKQGLKGFSLALAVAGVLALGTSEVAAFPIDPTASKAAPTNIAYTQWRGTQWIDPRCVRPNWSRHCRWHPWRSGAWPGIPRCYLYRGVCIYHTAPDWEEWYGY